MPIHPALTQTSVSLRADGACIDLRIGGHCKASLSAVEEDKLRDWLIARDASPASAPIALTLAATKP